MRASFVFLASHFIVFYDALFVELFVVFFLSVYFTVQSLFLQAVFQTMTLYAIVVGDAKLMAALYTVAVYVGTQGFGLSILFYKVCTLSYMFGHAHMHTDHCMLLTHGNITRTNAHALPVELD